MTTLRDAAQQALGALETLLSDAYHRRFPECCGRPGIECCGNPNEAWTPEDNKIMDLLSPAQRQLSEALRAALAEQAEQQCEYCKRGLKAGVCYCKPAEQEPVAAQHRFRHPEKGIPDWSVWQPCKINNKRPAHEIDSQGYQVEYRALYTAPQPAISHRWTPTAENINALPEPIRRYIADLSTNADPAGTVRDLTIACDTIRALEASNRMLRDAAPEAPKPAKVEQKDARVAPRGLAWDCVSHPKGGWEGYVHFDVPLVDGATLVAFSGITKE